MVVVGYPGAADRRPPLFSADPGCVGIAHSVANVVVVADGIERLAFRIVGAPLQQLGVENLLFDVGMYVELVAEGTPYAFDCAVVFRRLRLQIVQLGELFAEPVVVGEDQGGDVSHWDSLHSNLEDINRRSSTMRWPATWRTHGVTLRPDTLGGDRKDSVTVAYPGYHLTDVHCWSSGNQRADWVCKP